MARPAFVTAVFRQQGQLRSFPPDCVLASISCSQGMISIESSFAEAIEEPPSCVAFCPSAPDLVVIGTYVLHAAKHDPDQDDEEDVSTKVSSQQRTGSLLLYRLIGEKLELLQKVDLSSAVLDAEWSCHDEHGALIAIATSTGSLELFSLREDKLHKQAKLQISDPNQLVLDLDWHPADHSTIGVTLSGGGVALVHIDGDASSWNDETTFSLQEVVHHAAEPWTLAFSSDGTKVFSGGDDTVLQSAGALIDESYPLWKDSKAHPSGITSIHPLTDELLVTGSYDDHIRLFYKPAAQRASILAEVNLGGGVWRLKLLESHAAASGSDQSKSATAGASEHTAQSDRYTFLASCMHAGARIVRLAKSGDEWAFEVLARFDEHKSMNYGSDVKPDGLDSTFVSTSFYDKLVCVWRYDMQ